MSLSIIDAVERADWLLRYAYDRLGEDPRKFHPGVRSHLGAASVQSVAVVRLLDPVNDQKVVPFEGTANL